MGIQIKYASIQNNNKTLYDNKVCGDGVGEGRWLFD